MRPVPTAALPGPIPAGARSRWSWWTARVATWTGRRARIWAVTAALGVAAAAMASAAGDDFVPLHTTAPMPWILAVMFGAAEVFVLHIQLRREAQALSLSEVPLVLGMFYATPSQMLVGRLLGPLLVLIFHRRQRSATKVAFNLALFSADLMAAIVVFRLVLGGSVPIGPRAWLAAWAALAVFGGVDALAVTTVIGISEGQVRLGEMAREECRSVAMSLACGSVAIVAVNSLAVDGRTIWLLLGTAGVLTLGYRAYTALYERHLSLERLYEFSRVVSATEGLDAVLTQLVVEAKRLLRAEHATVVFLSPPAGARAIEVGPSGDVTRHEPARAARHPALGLILGSDGPVLAGRNTRDPALRRFLAATGHREAIMVPLRDHARVIGVVGVADRLGEVRTFDEADVRLLETVANHATVALENGHLIDRLRHEALHDALTGLPNRTFLQQAVADAVAGLTAGADASVAAIIMDLNGFKEVNDTLGHQHGDALLVEVAGRLVRAAGGRATVARLGGDEFAVLIPRVSSAAEAREAGEAIIAGLAAPFAVDDLELNITASLGISLAPQHATTASELLKKADIAMYSAKTAGGGARVYDPRLDTHSPERLALQTELRQAIFLEELTIDIQPKACVANHSVIGAEALARWTHPVYGPVAPEEFVAVAERSGLIRPLTLRVLDLALAVCASWESKGHRLGIAVNLSARNLTDPDLTDDVRALLERHAVDPSQLTFEVTESSVMTEPVHSVNVLSSLHEMGIHISIDDFGTGYSSLSYLKRLPVDEMKIDRSFVTDMLRDADDRTIVRSIVDLADNLSLSVVAEGVEDGETWQMLADMGCAQAQGYYLSPPLPVHAFERWLERHSDPAVGSAAGPPAS